MNTQSKVLRWSLIIGIVIVLNMFFNYALSLIYKQPEFNVYCPNTAQIIEANTKDVLEKMFLKKLLKIFIAIS